MSEINSLKFPSGRSISNLKKEAKALKQTRNGDRSLTQCLNELSRKNGLQMDWDEAIEHLKTYWSSWFAEAIYQEDAHWQIDVLTGGFKSREEAEAFSKPFVGKLLWVGGENPLIHLDEKTGETRTLFNSDVRLWKTKDEAREKIMISIDDMEQIHAPIIQWPELFGNNKPYFESLAWGVVNPSDPTNTTADSPGSRDSLDELEKIGLKFKAEQFNHNIYQIRNCHCPRKKFFYAHTDAPIDEINNIIAALFVLQEEDGKFPPYYGGSMSVTPEFVVRAMKECFGIEIVTCEHYDYYGREIDLDDDISVEVVEIFEIENGFDASQYSYKRHCQTLIENHMGTLLKAYRYGLGLPEEIDESLWTVVNINPNAVERRELPLTVKATDVNSAWIKRFDLDTVVFETIQKDDDCDFDMAYQLYNSPEESQHDYPIYRVAHPNFDLKAR